MLYSKTNAFTKLTSRHNHANVLLILHLFLFTQTFSETHSVYKTVLFIQRNA